MFNFIVKCEAWGEGHDSFPSSRIFEYTEQPLIDRFKSGDKLELEALKELPTVFVQEIYGDGNQVARVGKILSTYWSGQDVMLEYIYYQDVPPILNRNFQIFAGKLGIENFEFSRTHWSVKNVDLYRGLLSNLQPRRSWPNVFQLSDPEAIETLVYFTSI